MSIDFKLSARNIGPHRTLISNQKIGCCKIGIFANNGSGKTFLSRMFRLVGESEFEPGKLNDLLTIDERSGRFSFELNNSQESGRSRTLGIDLTRDSSQPVVSNETGYIFHVFNSDYVRENIEGREYVPNANVEGYILGKGNIDLSKEKSEFLSLQGKQEDLVNKIKTTVDTQRKKLDVLGIRKNLGEYKSFSYENISNDFKIEEPLPFIRLKELHDDLKAMPDDLADVRALSLIPEFPDFSAINELLQTAYSRSNMAEEFIEKVKAKQSFIESGLKITDERICPFCEQPFSEQAAELIKKYNEYLKDEEAEVGRSCARHIKQLRSLKDNIEKSIAGMLRSSQDFDEKKKYIPSMKSDCFNESPAADLVTEYIETLCQLLSDKSNHIDKTDFDTSILQRQMQSFFSEFEGVRKENAKKIDLINGKINNAQDEKRALDRRLCSALFLEVRSSLADEIGDISSLSTEINSLQSEIETREAKVRVEKKKRVAESLVRFLDLFFAGKYRFDADQFHITFEGKVLGKRIASVLSDGEKSIVAFCHYLAETHKHLSTEEDYKKLFFIMDDPISSLDFHYVYAIAQVIRNIGRYFDLQGHPKFIVLTHNIEFMSILSRNKIVLQRFFLTPEVICRLNEHFIMPYEAHLRDIFAVARNGSQPKHTTSNSIRHVLETISRFDAPRVKLEDYFQGIEELQGNEFVYSLMHDGSHGMIRNERAYTSEMIQRGCEAVIHFIENKFKGQIAHITEN
jgi:hypothetical protein